ncbi:MAG TPA: DUF1906 domain-containing protein, partial [Anaerolineales bacterium]|nr:DUF1906 domain-containing protein [Anaerolineales bacterium]
MTKKHTLIFLIALAALSVVLIAIFVANTPSSRAALQGGASPNLVPQVPTGWSGSVVPTFITGTHTTDSLYAGLGAVTYFDWAILNASDTSINTATTTCLSMDGIPINSWSAPTYAPNSFQTIEDFAYAVPEPGTFTLTLEADCNDQLAESDESDNTWTGEFTWNPYISVIIADEHGFDKCDIATTNQMDVWRNQSPYFYTNIYIGGISRACPNTGLTNNWIRNAVESGWNLIPTWVGPQAPCSPFNNRFSANPGTAREQGRREADAAYQTAQALGLIPPGSPTILYYDLEAFPNQKFCRQAAGQFLSGWTARLHELGQLSGIYGAGCGTYPVDWPALPAPPDAVWLAHWIYSEFNSNADVWNVACVPNTLWDNFERIRQYAGGHNETYGGVALNIDSNVALGPVVGI